MFKRSLNWYYPSSPEEAVKLVSDNPDTVFHAGGTGILRIRSSSVAGLVDLSAIGRTYIRQEENGIVIGGTTSFSDILSYDAGKHTPYRLLQNAAACAASTPLRHRITMGGSVADCPPWSDILAPLIVSEAQIRLLGTGGRETSLSMEEYFTQRKSLKRSLITEVFLPEQKWNVFFFKRYTRVTFEYAAFTIAGIGERTGNLLKNIRLAGSGGKKTYIPLNRPAELIKGNRVDEKLLDTAVEAVTADFPESPDTSGAFKFHLFTTFLKDALRDMAGISSEEKG